MPGGHTVPTGHGQGNMRVRVTLAIIWLIAHAAPASACSSQTPNTSQPASQLMPVIYHKLEEHQLVRNTTLTTLPVLGKEWHITHEMKPTSYPNGTAWTNSLHLGTGGFNAKYGDRVPLIHPYGSGRGIPSLTVASAISGEKNHWAQFNFVPLNTWTTISISQTLEDGTFMFRVSINDTELLVVPNLRPEEFRDVAVFASTPFGEAQEGAIRNLVIQSRQV